MKTPEKLPKTPEILTESDENSRRTLKLYEKLPKTLRDGIYCRRVSFFVRNFVIEFSQERVSINTQTTDKISNV